MLVEVGRAVALPLAVAGLVAAGPRPAGAQASGETAAIDELRRTVEELQRALGARDAAIANLLRRMGQLEQRVPVTAAEDQAPRMTLPGPPAVAEESVPSVAPRAAEPAPPPGPGRLEVDEEAAVTALERALVQEAALLLPPGTVQVEPSFTFTRRETAAPIFLMRLNQQLLAVDEVRRDSLEAGLGLRVGLPFDSQLTLDASYQLEDEATVTRVRFVGAEEETRTASGFGDLGVTVSKGLLRERGWRPDLIASVRWDTDTGQTEDGIPFGSGFDEITASLTTVKSQDPLVFIGGLSYTHAFERGGAQLGDVVGLSLGTALAASPETSLRFFLDQSFVLEKNEVDGAEVPGSDQGVGLFTIGASSILSPRVLLDVELGIGLTENAPDYTVSVSLPIRFNLPFRY